MDNTGTHEIWERTSSESPLEPTDLQDLQASGLSEAMIAAMGCFSKDAGAIAGYTGVKKVSAGYGIPYIGIKDQTGNPYCRYRLRKPVDDMKYVSGRGDDPQLYIPPGFEELSKNQVLIVTEGEKKAAKAVQEGLACVGLQGVYSWADAGARATEKADGISLSGDTEPLSELLTLCREFQRVLILGDSDLLDNAQAQHGLAVLESALLKRGVFAALGFCPPTRNSDKQAGAPSIVKQGLDDWLMCSSAAYIRRALEALVFAAPVKREFAVESFLAEHFSNTSASCLSYSSGRDWMVFNKNQWTPDHSKERYTKVVDYARKMVEVAKSLDAFKCTTRKTLAEMDQSVPMKAWCEFIEGITECLIKASAKLGTSRAIESLLKLAQPRLAVSDEVWDRDPHLLAVQNGVVDLRNGDLLPASPSFYNTHCCTVAYDPFARHIRWDEYLARVQPSSDKQATLKNLAGYLATGETREQAFFINYGAGGNGKSTFQQTLKDILGSYAVAASSALVDARAEPRENMHALAELVGRRLANISELEPDTRLASATIKRLTGEEYVSARQMYGHPFSFKPTCKLVIDTNHMPNVDDKTHSFKRRVRITQWNETISTEEMENGGRKLRKQLKEELPGVLAWIVEGAIQFYERGLGTSFKRWEEPVLTDLAEELLSQFLAVQMSNKVNLPFQSSLLLQAFHDFLAGHGSSVSITPQAFATKLEMRGFRRSKDSRGNMVWRGPDVQTLAIQAPWTPMVEGGSHIAESNTGGSR